MHACHATGCKTEIPQNLWGCRKHWGMVPKAIRYRILQHYRGGQESDWCVSREYLLAAKAAVVAVAGKEGRAPDVRLYEAFERRLGAPLAEDVATVLHVLAPTWAEGKTEIVYHRDEILKAAKALGRILEALPEGK